MRITNILPCPSYLSYAGTGPGGRTLNPGEASPVLPFKTLLVDQLWKDLHSDKIRIRLDKGDKDFISDMTAEDIRPIVVKKIPVPPPKPKPLPRPSNPAPKAAQPKNQAIKKAYKPIDAITAEKIRSGEVSIKDLQMQNVINTTPTTSSIPLTDPAQKATLKEIQAHMHGSI